MCRIMPLVSSSHGPFSPPHHQFHEPARLPPPQLTPTRPLRRSDIHAAALTSSGSRTLECVRPLRQEIFPSSGFRRTGLAAANRAVHVKVLRRFGMTARRSLSRIFSFTDVRLAAKLSGAGPLEMWMAERCEAILSLTSICRDNVRSCGELGAMSGPLHPLWAAGCATLANYRALFTLPIAMPDGRPTIFGVLAGTYVSPAIAVEVTGVLTPTFR